MQQVLEYLENQLAKELQAQKPELYHVSLALGIVEKALTRKEGSGWPVNLHVSQAHWMRALRQPQRKHCSNLKYLECVGASEG